MAYDVSVKIDLTKPVGKIGFGVPLVLITGAETPIEYTECKNLSDVIQAGLETSTDGYKTAELIFIQDNSPKKIAVCSVTGTAVEFLSDEKNILKDWRQLLVLSNGETDETSAIASKIETLEGKIFFANVNVDYKPSAMTSNKRTVVFYCNPTDEYKLPVAALVGETAGREAGSFTYKNLILKGIEPQDVSESRIEAIHEAGGITFVTKAGDNVTSEGIVASGEYIDIVDSEDYIIQQLAYQTQKLLNTSGKVPYDNNGIAMLESVAVNVMQDAYNKGIIATTADGGADYTVSYASREDTEATDRAERKYISGSFSFALAGAVHKVEITGEITI